MTKVFNKAKEAHKRQKLRRGMPPAELELWKRIRRKQLNGYRFRRQYSIDGFVVDFYCAEFKLAIEVDGPSHFVEGAPESDEEREKSIRKYGVEILRYSNAEVYERIDDVLSSLLQHCKRREVTIKTETVPSPYQGEG